MEPNKMLLIINPRSGVNSKAELAPAILQRLQSQGYDVDMQFTERAGHATALSREALSKGYGSVVVCGGDGTVNETARALCGTGIAMGIIPSGSGNGLARHLGIPVDEMMSLDVIERRNIIDCDCGVAAGRHFFCTFGLGFDAYVSRLFAGQKRRGRMTYMKLVMSEFSKYHPHTYRICADGQCMEREAFVVAVCNASQYGNNAFIAPGASVSDGKLDLVIVESSTPLAMVQTGLDVVTGMTPHNRHVETIRASRLSIEVGQNAYAHIDGEPITLPAGTINVECQPKMLRVYANTNIEHFTPFITPIDLTLRDWGIAIAKLFKQRPPVN